MEYEPEFPVGSFVKLKWKNSRSPLGEVQVVYSFPNQRWREVRWDYPGVNTSPNNTCTHNTDELVLVNVLDALASNSPDPELTKK